MWCGVGIITRRVESRHATALWTLYRCHLHLPFSLVMISHHSQDNHYNPKREGSELGKRSSLCLRTFPQLNRNKCVITLAAVSAVTFAATRVSFVYSLLGQDAGSLCRLASVVASLCRGQVRTMLCRSLLQRSHFWSYTYVGLHR